MSRVRRFGQAPGHWLKTLSALPGRALGRLESSRFGYRIRKAREIRTFASCREVHDLPPIFHYWSNRYLRPKLERHGFDHPDAFFVKFLSPCIRSSSSDVARVLSIGSGNCDTEVRIARALVDLGLTNFAFECLDVSQEMLDRGRALAIESGVAAQMRFSRVDLNRHLIGAPADAIMANQSLHHIVELERLFDSIRQALLPHGRFMVSDMIGRNGHMRWPEARDIVSEFWRELPERYRYNHQLRRTEKEFLDWDCSVSGFEGIRAQDILSLCVDRFGFDLFLGFANVIDPFIDRGFGPNFNVQAPWDREFIDRVHERDEVEIRSGHVKPTHMFAVMKVGDGANEFHDGLSPRRAIRHV